MIEYNRFSFVCQFSLLNLSPSLKKEWKKLYKVTEYKVETILFELCEFSKILNFALDTFRTYVYTKDILK